MPPFKMMESYNFKCIILIEEVSYSAVVNRLKNDKNLPGLS